MTNSCIVIMQGFVYETAPDFFAGERGWLGYSEGKLFFFPLGLTGDTITVLDPKTLAVETTFELEGIPTPYMYMYQTQQSKTRICKCISY